MVLEKQIICKYEVTWGKNDLVNESALNQKAFILLALTGVSYEGLHSCMISFRVSFVILIVICFIIHL